jgi:hypothetical protein
MKQSGTFVFAMTVSACLTFAGRWVIGSGGVDVRPLAKSLGAATINECRVTGRIESRPQGVYAVFEFENPTKAEKEIKFNYLASHTPPASMLSRMGPFPKIVKDGTVEHRLAAGLSNEEVLLKETAPAAPGRTNTSEQAGGVLVTGVVAKLGMGMTPEIWSLVVSREKIQGIHGWGAVAPAASDTPISLDKGEVVLAITPQEKSKP